MDNLLENAKLELKLCETESVHIIILKNTA